MKLRTTLLVGPPFRSGELQPWLGGLIGRHVDGRAARDPSFEDDDLMHAQIQERRDDRRRKLGGIARQEPHNGMTERFDESRLDADLAGRTLEHAPVLAYPFPVRHIPKISDFGQANRLALVRLRIVRFEKKDMEAK